MPPARALSSAWLLIGSWSVLITEIRRSDGNGRAFSHSTARQRGKGGRGKVKSSRGCLHPIGTQPRGLLLFGRRAFLVVSLGSRGPSLLHIGSIPRAALHDDDKKHLSWQGLAAAPVPPPGPRSASAKGGSKENLTGSSRRRPHISEPAPELETVPIRVLRFRNHPRGALLSMVVCLFWIRRTKPS